MHPFLGGVTFSIARPLHPGVDNPVSEYLSKIGRKGTLKEGRAREANLNTKRREEIDKKPAEACWESRRTR